jgi:PAS domain S-box-containing protein
MLNVLPDQSFDELFRTAVGVMREGVVLLDADGRIALSNPSAERLLGLGVEASSGRMIPDPAWKRIDENGEPIAASRDPGLAALRTGEPQRDVRQGVMIPDGGVTWVSVYAQPLFRPSSSRPHAAVVTFTDITLRKDAEDHLSSLLEQERAARVLAESAATRMRALQSVTDISLAALSLDEFLVDLLARLCTMLATDSATILLISPDGESLGVRASIGLEEGEGAPARVPVGEGIAGQIAATRRTMVIENIASVEVVRSALHRRVHSLIGAPLISAGRIIGVVHLGSSTHRRFTPEEAQLLELVADRAADSIDRARLFEEERRLREEAERAHRQLRELARRMESVREEEQIRLARQIHDELGPALTAVKMDVAWLDNRLSSVASEEEAPPLWRKTAAMMRLIDQAVDDVRNISADLRPVVLDDLGLVPALEWLAADFGRRSGIRVEITDATGDFAYKAEYSTLVFLIVKEILTNAVRHSGAMSIQIAIGTAGEALEIEVVDDGRGITEEEAADPRALGILGMRERALILGGDLAISGIQGRGTRALLTVPRRARVRP